MLLLEQFINGYPETNDSLDEERLYNAVFSKKDDDIYESIEELKSLLSKKYFNEEQKHYIVHRFEALWYFQDFLKRNNYLK